MKKQLEIFGDDLATLVSLCRKLKANGIQHDLRGASLQGGDNGGASICLIVVGVLTPFIPVLITFLKNRTRRTTIELNGEKIDVEGKSAEEVERLLRSGVICLRKLKEQNKD
jgi:hypothetical protein